MIEKHVDYIQFSAPFNEFNLIQFQFDQITPTQYYRRGYRDPNGIRYYFGNFNPKVTGAFCVMSGAAIENMRTNENSDAQILQWIYEAGGKITRLDLAITEWVSNALIRVQDIERFYRKSLITSNLTKYGARSIVAIPSENAARQVETFYIGDLEKRSDTGIFRAYDKGIELDLGQYLSTRLELELRGDSANNTAKRIAQSGDIAGNFRSKFDINHREWRRVMDADPVPVIRGKKGKNIEREEEEARRWDWLMDQVAPALKEAIERDMKKDGKRTLAFLSKAGIIEDVKRRGKNYGKYLFNQELIKRGGS